MLHLLEHLREPERAVAALSSALAKGGVMPGGFPVLPAWMRANLLFGAIFPAWPGELYWRIRRLASASSAMRAGAVPNGFARR